MTKSIEHSAATKKSFYLRDDWEFCLEGNRWQLNKNSILNVVWVYQLTQEAKSSYLLILAKFPEECALTTSKYLNYETPNYFVKK